MDELLIILIYKVDPIFYEQIVWILVFYWQFIFKNKLTES